MRARNALLGVIALTLATACADGDPTHPGAPGKPPVDRVEVQPGHGVMVRGDTLRLVATPRSAQGLALPDRLVAWSTDDSLIAAVTDGLVTALAPGEVTITAISEGRAGTARVTVSAPALPRPEVSNVSPAAVPAGGLSFWLVIDGNGFVENTAVLWNGATRLVEYVSGTQIRAFVLADDIRQSGQVRLTVFNPPPGGGAVDMTFVIEPSPTSISVARAWDGMWPGDTQQLSATLRDDRGRPMDGHNVVWSSNDPTVADVTGAGVVRAYAPGQAIITASAAGRSGSTFVTVLEQPSHDLVYESNRFGVPELWVLTPGTESLPRRLLAAGTFATQPAASPDGGRIAFVGRDPGLNRDIYVVNRDGTGLRRLTFDAAVDDQPSWSPDGTGIVFRSMRSGYADIWVMQADGSGQSNLTHSEFRVGTPSAEWPVWSPDGSRIVFAFGDAGMQPLRMVIASMKPDGTDRRVLRPAAPGSETQPSFSPDGLTIALRRTTTQLGDHIALITAGGDEVYGPSPPGPGQKPAWSPDGRWIVFMWTPTGSGTADLHMVRPDGTMRRPVSSTTTAWADAANPAWVRR